MDKLKQQIQRKLVANVLVDQCAHSEYLIFRDAWCTQERVLRFTTPFFRKLFSYEESESGKWKTGDMVMYEIQNGGNSLKINCVLNTGSVKYSQIEAERFLLQASGAAKTSSSSDIILKCWELSPDDGDVNKLFALFGDLLSKEIPYWEQCLQEKLNALQSESTVLHEGTEACVTLSKYERNPKARAACIAAHGTACMICGIDFAKAYGPEFNGKIEVHHIVPLHEIKEDYVVDPVKDLIPVCPNCHSVLHSKPDGGYYTPEELKKMLPPK